MIELVFVIVIIGILSAIAIPKLAVTRDDAIITKVKSQVASIRSGIAMQKSKNLLEGNSVSGSFYPQNLDNVQAGDYNSSGERLFNYNEGNTSNILEYPIYSKLNHVGSWVETNTNVYVVTLSDSNVTFDYNTTTGIFNCSRDLSEVTQTQAKYCKDLTE